MKRFRFLAVALAAVFVFAACSSDDGGSDAASSTGAGASTGGSASMAAESPAPEMTDQTIADVVAGNEDFSTLLAAVKAAKLGDTLAGPGPYTVFAPTDEAFAALPEGTLESLLQPKNRDALASILTYHVVPGEVMAADVMPGEITTVEGEAITVSTDGADVVLTDAMGDDVKVVQTDIPASNGVIHVIDGVLLP